MVANSPQEIFSPSLSHVTLEMLNMWRIVLLKASQKHNAYDISFRQSLILLTVYLKSPPHTVGGLSAALSISKPAICRALDALAILGMVRRKRDQSDKRLIQVQRTVKGSVYLSEFAEIIKYVSQKTIMHDRTSL